MISQPNCYCVHDLSELVLFTFSSRITDSLKLSSKCMNITKKLNTTNDKRRILLEFAVTTIKQTFRSQFQHAQHQLQPVGANCEKLVCTGREGFRAIFLQDTNL